MTVFIGPLVLILRPLVWHGDRGEYGPPVALRFGGIENFRNVAARFQTLPSLDSEIGFLGPDPDSAGRKRGLHHFKFESERRDFEFSFHFSNVTIEDAG